MSIPNRMNRKNIHVVPSPSGGWAREKEQLVLLSQLRRNRKPLIKEEGYPNVKEESSSVTEKMAKSNGETVMETILIHPEVNS